MVIESILLNLPPGLIKDWGYIILLFSSLLEAVPPLGIIIPGQTLVIVGGFLARLHFLSLRYVFLVATFGAIIGDTLGYLLGRKFGHEFLIRHGSKFFFKQSYYEKTKKLMHEHTGKTLIIGRFNSITRAFAPFVAGSTKVDFSKFMFYNVLGGISWAFCFVLLGFIFGESYKIAARYFGYFVVSAVVISLLIIYGYRFMSSKKDFVNKYHLYALIINIFSTYLFFSMLEGIVYRELITRIDLILNDAVMKIWNPVLTKIMILVTNILSPTTMVILSLILFAVFIHQKKRYLSLLLASSLTLGVFLEQFVKEVVRRARPLDALTAETGFSFPSAHVVLATIFFSLLIYAFREQIKESWKRGLFIGSCIVLFLLVGFSRIYLHVHWFSDVIGGIALGLFILTFLILSFKFVIYMRKTEGKFILP